MPSRVPNGVKPTALRKAGKVDNAVPDADVPTGQMSAKLNDMPGPRRQRTTEQFDQLDSDGSDYLGNTDIEDPSLKAADLFENTGPKGRRALNDLADGDREAVDVLLQMDDAATQWRFARAYNSGDLDSDELGTALNRYDSLDSDGKRFAGDVIRQTGDDGPELMSADVCNSPCHGTIRAVYEYTDGSDGVTLSDSEAKDLLKAYDEADDVTDRPGENGPGAVQERLDEFSTGNGDGERVDGVERSMKSVSGDETGFTEVAGETRIADDALNADSVRKGDVHLQRNIDSSEVPNSLSKESSEVDVDLDSEITIDGETVDSPALESKNLNADSYSDSFIENVWTERVSAKFAAQAGAGKDEIVLVVPDAFKNRFGDELDTIPGKVERRLNNGGVSADPTVRITTYDNIGS